MYPFTYCVVFAEDWCAGLFHKECGAGLCASYADAAQKLESYYGYDLVKILYLQRFEEASLITLTPNAFNETIKSLNDFNSTLIRCDKDGNPTPTEANDVVEKGSNIYEC